MIQALDGGLVTLGTGEGTPQEELVDGARPRVGVSADQIGIHRLQVRRSQDLAPHNELGEAGHRLIEAGLDPVGVGLPHRLGPRTLHGDLTEGVAPGA